MRYTIRVDTDVNQTVSSWQKDVQTPEQVRAYILEVIDQPDIQALLSRVEFHEYDSFQTGFVPLASEIEDMCNELVGPACVFHAGEDIGSAICFGIQFMVLKQV
jgi:hypothetical protein